MKAVLLDKPGPPSSLRIGEILTPRPGVDEALVRVCATSLNPVDYKVAAQGYDGWRYPHVLGVDVAGVIETTGEGVVSYGLAGFSAAARGFGSNGDRADGASKDREDQTNRCGTNYIGSDSEGIGTTGRGTRPRQNCCRSATLISEFVGF
jgi:threonine dehydrogenase-like Zn-dependent dehydrogenase